MIDIENEIFNKLATQLRAQYSNCYVTGEYTHTPPKFPCISIVEKNNTTYTRTLTSANTEQYADVMYQIDVYSNLTEKKKAQAKAIMNLIDSTMVGLNFERTMCEPIENLSDKNVYRITARYKAVIDSNTIYRR